MSRPNATGLTNSELRSLFGPASETARTFSAAEKRAGAKSGAALPNGSFRIDNQADADNAAGLRGNGRTPEATVVAHIRKRVKALGLKMPAGMSDGDE